ncbi:MAG: hypothetical protein ABIH25_05050 [Candidatus Woesearchaeota archaeon]
MTYEIINKNAQTLKELAEKYQDLKIQKQTSKVKKQSEKIKIYMLNLLRSIEDLSE